MLRAFACAPGEPAVEIAAGDVAARLGDGRSRVWIDIAQEIDAHLPFLADTMKFHPLAIEDLASAGMLPKVEEHDSGLFLLVNDIVLTEEDEEDRLRTYQLFLFLGKDFLVTVHRRRIRSVDAQMADAASLTRLLGKGPEVLAHAILIGMIDRFFPMLDRVEARIDAAEEAIFRAPAPEELQRIFGLRKDCVRLRSIAQRQLGVIGRIASGEFDSVTPQGLLLARDLLDHLDRFSEKAAGFREEIIGLLDAYLSQQSNRMNDVVRVLTIMATIMLPLSIVVGFFGMNFRTMPLLEHPLGWLFTLIAMATLIGGMLVYFRRKGWI